MCDEKITSIFFTSSYFFLRFSLTHLIAGPRAVRDDAEEDGHFMHDCGLIAVFRLNCPSTSASPTGSPQRSSLRVNGIPSK